MAHAFADNLNSSATINNVLGNVGAAALATNSESLDLDTITQVLHAIPAGVLLLDNNGRVEVANQLAKDLLGEPLEQQLWRRIIKRSFKPRKDDGLEISLVDGRRIKLSVSSLSGYQGQLIHLTDLTETRLLQSKVGHMQKLYSLGKMVASLAHQIRTPLSAAMLYAANLTNPSIKPVATKRFSEKLLNRLKELESQVNDMLLFARSDSQQVVEEISVNSLIEETYQTYKDNIADKGSSLDLGLMAEDHTILGNVTALKGALHNLIHNAIEIGGQGTFVRLAAQFTAGEIHLVVSDDGPGIKVAHFSQLFEPFYTTRPQGTGLGLAVVHSVAKAHRGRVFARNNLTGGASFEVILPSYSMQKKNDEHYIPTTPNTAILPEQNEVRCQVGEPV